MQTVELDPIVCICAIYSLPPMFPNAQDALPLPLRPNFEHYKKLARDLVTACKSGDPDAIGDWAEAWLKTLVKQSGIKLGRKESRVIGRWTNQVEGFAQRKLSNTDGPQCRLADAQSVSLDHTGLRIGPGSPNILGGSRKRVHSLQDLKLLPTRSATAILRLSNDSCDQVSA